MDPVTERCEHGNEPRMCLTCRRSWQEMLATQEITDADYLLNPPLDPDVPPLDPDVTFEEIMTTLGKVNNMLFGVNNLLRDLVFRLEGKR